MEGNNISPQGSQNHQQSQQPPKRPKKKRLKGLSGALAKLYLPLNEDEIFRRVFADKNKKILFRAKGAKNAALFILENGQISIEMVDAEPKSNLKKKNLHWNAYLETTVMNFLDMGAGKIRIKGIIKLVLKRKMKIRGMKSATIMMKINKFLKKPGMKN